MKHEFHFLLNQEQYLMLLKLSKHLNKNLSASIVKACENLKSFIEKNHLISKEKGSRYQTLSGSEEKQYHIHCYLPENLYKKLKQIHLDLNTYSLAQILRKIIENYLMGCSKYGIKGFTTKLESINDNWENKKAIYKKEKKVFFRQMSYKLYNSQYLKIIYSKDSSPFSIQFI
jgi:hypothetical protein